MQNLSPFLMENNDVYNIRFSGKKFMRIWGLILPLGLYIPINSKRLYLAWAILLCLRVQCDER
jgi:hypothetical protein